MADSRLFSEFEPSSGVAQNDPREAQQGQRTTDKPYAVIRRYAGVDPHHIDEIVRQVNDGLLPIVSRIPGFVAYCALHTGGDVVASISVFEDRAGADESTRQAAVWVRQHLASLIPQPPQFTAGHVIAFQAKSSGQSSRPGD